MNEIIETNRIGAICAICLEGFIPGEKQYTHKGGENHDGFHKGCLKDALKVNPICPYEKMHINPNSLIPLTERIAATLKLILFNAGCAALLGLGVSAAATAAGAASAAAGAVSVVGTFLVTGLGEEAAGAGVRATVAAIARVAIVAGVRVGVIAGAAVIAGEEITRGTAVIAGATGVAINLFSEYIEVSEKDRKNIGNAMIVAGLTSQLAVDAGISPLAAIPIIGGLAAAIFSLVRRR